MPEKKHPPVFSKQEKIKEALPRELRDTIENLVEQRKQEILSLLEDGELDAQEVEFLCLGLKDFLRACESSQALTAYIKEYVLSLDADLMKQYGFTLDSKGALTAQKKSAQDHLKRLRQTIVDGIHEIEDIVKPRILMRREVPKEPGEAHDAFVKELDKLGIPEQSRQSFLTRAYEKRKATEAALATPEERIRSFVEELFRTLEPLIIQMLLTVEQKGESTAKPLRKARAGVGNIVKSPAFLLNVPGAVILYPLFFYSLSSGRNDALTALSFAFAVAQLSINVSTLFLSSVFPTDKSPERKIFHERTSILADMLQSVLKRTESAQKTQAGQKTSSSAAESLRMLPAQEKHIGPQKQEPDHEDQPRQDTRQTE